MNIFELYYILKTSYTIYSDVLKFSKIYFFNYYYHNKNDILYITEIEDDILLIDI